tara:strand:- start:16365 stop:17093 length:729 start_codon:yes stop_codon:yes gene_type:complete
MSLNNGESALPNPTWTKDDVIVLEAIDDYYAAGLIRFLGFLVGCEGTLSDSTFDLILVVHSIINPMNEYYSFDDAESLVAVASEFCLVDCEYENQVLSMVELQDNAVLFLAMHGEHNFALDAAVCLSVQASSIMSDRTVLPSLALFGEWEEIATIVLDALLTQGKLRDSIGWLMEETSHTILCNSEIEFVGIVRKLCASGLLDVTIGVDDKALVGIEQKAAGLFLLFSGRTEMARTLADLSV